MKHVDASLENLETKINKRFISEINHMLQRDREVELNIRKDIDS